MRRKDKAPAGPSGEDFGDEESEPVVRLSVPEKPSDPEAELRKAQRLMHSDDPAGQYAQPNVEEESVEADPLELNPEEDWVGQESARGKLPIGFVFLGVGVIIALFVWMGVMARRGEVALDSDSAKSALFLEMTEEEVRESTALLSRMEELARAYLAAETPEEKSRYVRERERVGALMKGYYQSRPLEPQVYQRVKHFAPLGIEQRSYLILHVEVGASGKEGKVSLVVEHTEDDELLVDWESEVAYQPMALEEYIASKPSEAMEFRMYVARDDRFYNFEFSDAERYLCVMLTERDTDAYLFGYVERGSRVHQDVEALMKNSVAGREPAIVRIRFLPQTPSRRSVLIEKIVAPRWIYPAEPDSSSSSSP